MEPSLDTHRIALDVSGRLSPDQERLRAGVKVRFEAGAGDDLIEAHRIAEEVLAAAWGEIEPDCRRALADVHELYLAQAARVLEARRDLDENGAESWIAGAVIKDQGFHIAWDVLDEEGLLIEFDC